MKKASRLTPFEDWCLALIVFVTVLSVAKALPIPLNDSALYERYGFGLIHGQHLYSDLPEVKLPSLYYTNALYQLLFGQNYFLHTLLEAVLNLGTIALFANALRRLGVAAWAPGALLFAFFYTLPIPQFNYPEYYAIPLMLLCFNLALSGRNLAAGVAMALATTYWIPSPIMLVPLLLRDVPWGQRRNLIGGFVGTFVAFAIALIPLLGVRWILEPLSQWPSFMRALSPQFGIAQMFKEVDGTLFHAGFGALVCLLLVVIKRPSTEGQRFTLIWALCALIAAVIPPRFFEWYFLPEITALCATIAAFGFSRGLFARSIGGALRSVAALAFVAFMGYGLFIDVVDHIFLERYAADVMTTSNLVRNSLGLGWVLYTPLYTPEVFLLTEAVETDPGASATGHFTVSAVLNGGVTIANQRWERAPQLVVDGGPFNPAGHYAWLKIANRANQIVQTFVPICSDETGQLALYAQPALCPVFVAHNPGCRCPA